MYFVFFMRETTYTVCSHGKENLLDRVNQTDVRMTLKYYTSSSIDMSHTISIDFTIDYIYTTSDRFMFTLSESLGGLAQPCVVTDAKIFMVPEVN